MSLFKKILALLFPPRTDELLVEACEESQALESLSLNSFSLESTSGVSLLSYKNTLVRAFIREAKFHHNEKALQLLSAVLAEYLLEKVADESAFGAPVVLLPIPLGEKRQKERGYNQVEEVCLRALPHLGPSVELMKEVLIRTKETLPQTTLSKEARRENMRGAFSVSKPLNPSHVYIVIDDVMTTGATLSSAVSALKEGEAKNISALALAH